jgi:hypothetical protein
MSPPLVRCPPLLGLLFKAPTLLFSLNWWLVSRYRTGEHVHQAVPYGLLALVFSGDWSR